MENDALIKEWVIKNCKFAAVIFDPYKLKGLNPDAGLLDTLQFARQNLKESEKLMQGEPSGYKWQAVKTHLGSAAEALRKAMESAMPKQPQVGIQQDIPIPVQS